MAIYYPETIDSMPLPGIEYEQTTESKSSTTGGVNYAERVPVNVSFPIKPVAVETIGQSFNTKTKKILGEFTFGILGAISVGQYEYGVSGEVKISPNGIIAKNINGDTTFALDAVSGDATFAGTILAGSVVAGNVTVTGAFIVSDGLYDIILLGRQVGGFI